MAIKIRITSADGQGNEFELDIEDPGIDGSIAYIDPDSGEVVVVASIEEPLSDVSTAAGGADIYVINGGDFGTGNGTLFDFGKPVEGEPVDVLDLTDVFSDPAAVLRDPQLYLGFDEGNFDGDESFDDTAVSVDSSGEFGDPVMVLFTVGPDDLSLDPTIGNVDV